MTFKSDRTYCLEKAGHIAAVSHWRFSGKIDALIDGLVGYYDDKHATNRTLEKTSFQVIYD